MDKVFSTRIDEKAVRRVDSIARRLRTSKKSVVEKAIEMYAQSLGDSQQIDVFERTCGTWRRNEKPDRTVSKARIAFRRSMKRHRP